jgi:hypothetical protein
MTLSFSDLFKPTSRHRKEAAYLQALDIAGKSQSLIISKHEKKRLTNTLIHIPWMAPESLSPSGIPGIKFNSNKAAGFSDGVVGYNNNGSPCLKTLLHVLCQLLEVRLPNEARAKPHTPNYQYLQPDPGGNSRMTNSTTEISLRECRVIALEIMTLNTSSKLKSLLDDYNPRSIDSLFQVMNNSSSTIEVSELINGKGSSEERELHLFINHYIDAYLLKFKDINLGLLWHNTILNIHDMDI